MKKFFISIHLLVNKISKNQNNCKTILHKFYIIAEHYNILWKFVKSLNNIEHIFLI